MLDPDKTLALAEQVSQAAESLGIQTALIGATALAVHGFTRGTDDVDLASVVPPDTLRQLLTVSKAAGLKAKLRLPDDDLPGGVLVVWASEDQNGDPIDVGEVVNFYNPLRPVANPAAKAIARAFPLDVLRLRCVALPDLVALKLYAGSGGDLNDIVQLLANNPDTDLDAVRSIAQPFDKANSLDN